MWLFTQMPHDAVSEMSEFFQKLSLGEEKMDVDVDEEEMDVDMVVEKMDVDMMDEVNTAYNLLNRRIIWMVYFAITEKVFRHFACSIFSHFSHVFVFSPQIKKYLWLFSQFISIIALYMNALIQIVQSLHP